MSRCLFDTLLCHLSYGLFVPQCPSQTNVFDAVLLSIDNPSVVVWGI